MLYLASSSPRRREVLKSLGVNFRVRRPDYHERNHRHEVPSKIVQRHALGKATSVAKKLSFGTVLGADTLVFHHKKIIGKPRNLKEARKILSALQGRWHVVYTGVALLDVSSGVTKRKRVFFEKTSVRLKKMSQEEILSYFKKINPLDKAGAYAIQDRRGSIVEEIKGSFSNAVGLPVEKLYGKLKP